MTTFEYCMVVATVLITLSALWLSYILMCDYVKDAREELKKGAVILKSNGILLLDAAARVDALEKENVALRGELKLLYGFESGIYETCAWPEDEGA